MRTTSVPSSGPMTSWVLSIATEARARALGPFSPSFKVNELIKDGMIALLPDDIHLKVISSPSSLTLLDVSSVFLRLKKGGLGGLVSPANFKCWQPLLGGDKSLA